MGPNRQLKANQFPLSTRFQQYNGLCITPNRSRDHNRVYHVSMVLLFPAVFQYCVENAFRRVFFITFCGSVTMMLHAQHELHTLACISWGLQDSGTNTRTLSVLSTKKQFCSVRCCMPTPQARYKCISRQHLH